MEQLYIADVADVTFEDSDGNVIFTAEGQISSVSGDEDSEKIFGGIGNKHLYTIRHSKELTLGITNATFNLEFLAMTQGASINNDTATVTEYERDLVVDNSEIKIKDEEYNGEVLLKNKNGLSKRVEAADGVIELTPDFADNGDKLDVAYNKEIEGQTIVLDATQFSKSYKVTYRTIVYSVENNEVVADLYFIFPNASPAGNYEISLENGDAYTPELEFDVMAKSGTDELGRIVQVPRVKESTP